MRHCVWPNTTGWCESHPARGWPLTGRQMSVRSGRRTEGDAAGSGAPGQEFDSGGVRARGTSRRCARTSSTMERTVISLARQTGTNRETTERLGTLSSQLQKKTHPKTLSCKNTFIQKHFHPKTLSSKNTFVQNHFIQKRRQFHPRHFHPKTGSSNDTFIQKRFRPMTLSSKNGFVQ